MMNQTWEPEIENDTDDDILERELREYMEVCEDYCDFLIKQKQAGIFNK